MASEANLFLTPEGKAMDISGASQKENANVIVFQYHGGENQLFFFDRQIGWIISVFSRKAVTVKENMKDIVQKDYCSLSRQQWVFEDTTQGTIIRCYEEPTLVLSLADDVKHVCLKPFSNEAHQFWTIQQKSQ